MLKQWSWNGVEDVQSSHVSFLVEPGQLIWILEQTIRVFTHCEDLLACYDEEWFDLVFCPNIASSGARLMPTNSWINRREEISFYLFPNKRNIYLVEDRAKSMYTY